MPIVDIELVAASEANFHAVSAQTLADTLGAVFGSSPGRTWVRLRWLAGDCYAENDAIVPTGELPVFATVLLARLPPEPELIVQVEALTRAIAVATGRPADRVHVCYLPAAAGRQAFGGRLVQA